MKFNFSVNKRTEQGSGASRRLRRAGKVPGILYGVGGDPVQVEMDHNAIYLALRKEVFHASVIDLDIDGTKELALLRDAQVHPYKPIVLHVDFQRVSPTEKLHIKLPLHFINADIAPGVKLGGGIVAHVMNDVEVSCLAADLPEYIEVDLQNLQAGQSLHISDLKLPKGVEIVVHGGQSDGVIASIASVRGGKAAAAEASA
jgi:large subunit ribosomal protein L25